MLFKVKLWVKYHPYMILGSCFNGRILVENKMDDEFVFEIFAENYFLRLFGWIWVKIHFPL